MPTYTLRLGERTYFVNARGKRSALALARSMLTDDMPSDQVVKVAEGEDGAGPVIFQETVGAMLAGATGRLRPSA